MFLIKNMLKVIILPVVLAMTATQWVGEFLIGLSSAILNLIAWLILLIAATAFMLGISDGQEALVIALTGFMFFLVPRIGGAVIGIISATNDFLWRLMKS